MNPENHRKSTGACPCLLARTTPWMTTNHHPLWCLNPTVNEERGRSRGKHKSHGELMTVHIGINVQYYKCSVSDIT